MLLDLGANLCFVDQDFAATQEILLYNRPRPTSVAVIDGHCIASRDINEESKPIHVVLGI